MAGTALAAAVVLSGGALLPFFVGSSMALIGASDITEGGFDIWYGLTDPSNDLLNLVKEYLFGGDEGLYNTTAYALMLTAPWIVLFAEMINPSKGNNTTNISEKAKWKNEEATVLGYGEQLKISDQRMYQLGKHFNKHGRSMGFGSKKEYDAGARAFIEENKGTAEIFEGIWNSNRGDQGRQTQVIIRAGGKQAIINKSTGQIIDFYEGTSLNGFINIRKVQ
ncbi:hypothetical protein ABXS75_18485 [Roseburia hominis]